MCDLNSYELLRGIVVPNRSVFEKSCFDLTLFEAEQVKLLYRWFYEIASAAINESGIVIDPGGVTAMRIEYLEDIRSWQGIHFAIFRPGYWEIRMQGKEVLEYRITGNDTELRSWLVEQLREGSEKFDPSYIRRMRD